MPYRSMLLGRLHFVRWGTPVMDDVDRVLHEVQRGFSTSRQPLIGISLVPVDAEPPKDEVRAAMVRNMDKLLACSERLYFVMEGSGFRHSVMRSVLAGLLLVGGKRGRVVVHDSLDTVIALVAPQVGRSVAEIVQAGRAHGVVLPDQAVAG
ncbi:MAG: hypothetical protein IPJ34_16090 [Myxococcales bacterium]|nr:hypothetical protein [Myxococcales bacterium]